MGVPVESYKLSPEIKKMQKQLKQFNQAAEITAKAIMKKQAEEDILRGMFADISERRRAIVSQMPLSLEEDLPEQ